MTDSTRTIFSIQQTDVQASTDHADSMGSADSINSEDSIDSAGSDVLADSQNPDAPADSQDPEDSDEFPEYDAFISYKHGAIDSEAAKALQKNLENFHLPLLSGGFLSALPLIGRKERKIQRVFVDDGELSACAAFSSYIRKALEHSRWLIIICSPETKKSPWVNMEIEIFLEYHDRDHILAVMTDGEPADIFPTAFADSGDIQGEMLAADARGRTLREVLHKLKKDALLRIAAPILEMSYDELKQRHRAYRMQRFAVTVSICLAVLTGFLMYAFVQNQKLSQSNRDLLLRRSEILTQEASRLLDEGDNYNAVLNLLEALPGQGADSASSAPVLPSAVHDLTGALNLYTPELSPNYGPYHLEACSLIEGSDYLASPLLCDREGEYLFGHDNNYIYVWEIRSDRLVRTLSYEEALLCWSPGILPGSHRIILCEPHLVRCIDYLTGETIWSTTIINEISETVCSENSDLPLSERRMYILSENILSVLNLSDGSMLSEQHLVFSDGRDSISYEEDFGEESEKFIYKVRLSQQEDYFLFDYSLPDFSDIGSYQYHLVLCDPSTGEALYVPYDENGNTTSPFPFDDYIMTQLPDGERLVIFLYSIQDGDSTQICRMTAWSMDTKSIKWQSDYSLTEMTEADKALQYSGRYSKKVQLVYRSGGRGEEASFLFGCNSHVFLVRAKDGRRLHDTPISGECQSISFDSDGQYAILTAKGNYYSSDGKKDSLLTAVMPAGCTTILPVSSAHCFYCLQDNHTILKYAPVEADTRFGTVSGSFENRGERILTAGPKWIVWEWSESFYWFSTEEYAAEELSSKEILQAAGLNEEGVFTDIFFLSFEEDILSLALLDSDYSAWEGDEIASACYRIDVCLTDKSITCTPLLAVDTYMSNDSYFYNPRNETMYVIDSFNSGFMIFTIDLRTKKVEKHMLSLPFPGTFFCRFNPDRTKILLPCSSMKAYIVNLETFETTAEIDLSGFEESFIIDSLYRTDGDCVIWGKKALAIAGHSQICLFDEKGKLLRTLTLSPESPAQDNTELPALAFSPDGQTLYALASHRLLQYRLGDEKSSEILLPSYSTYSGLYTPKCFFFGQDYENVQESPAGGKDFYGIPEKNVLRFLYDHSFYAVCCDENAFGIITRIPGACAYNPWKRQIFLDQYDSDEDRYKFIYYHEYSLTEIIGIAREAYNLSPEE